MRKHNFLNKVVFTAILGTSLISCTGNSSGDRVKEAIKAAEKLTYTQLLEKAKEEVGTNSVEVYGNSSALTKALELFTESTGIKINNNKLGDAALYDKLFYTIGANKYSADMVLIQDGNKLQSQMLNTEYLLNYIPLDYKTKLAADDQTPVGAIYLNKVFMYNNTNFDGNNAATAAAGTLKNHLTNVWQVAGKATDEKHISGVSFKNPSSENINMNFLIQLTSDHWVGKLTAAYKDYYGKDYAPDTEEAKKYPNIGYKWIGEFLENVSWHSSDGTATKTTGAGLGGKVVFANFNKLKDLKETGVGKQDTANITTAVLENPDIKGFGGFVYKMYSLIAKNAKYPYAAAALVNFIISKEGYAGAWGANLGYYSTNPDNAIAEGDKELSWWKEHTVIEDAKYVSEAYLDVSEFILKYES